MNGIEAKLDEILATASEIAKALSGEVEPDLFDAIAGDETDTIVPLYYTSPEVQQARTMFEVSRRGETINLNLRFYGYRSLHVATLRRGQEAAKP